MEEEETLRPAGSLKNPRPHITLRIPPPTPGSTCSRPPTHYYTGPLTPTAVNISDGGVNVFTMYPGKAGQFVSKQFLSFRDFTLKSAKSGLSVGEKASFWMYGKIWALSRKWFTHFFLFAVVAAYSLLGGFLFMEIEGNAEKEAYEDIVALRKNLVLHIKNLYEENQPLEIGSQGDLMWQGRSAQAIIEYENKLLEHFKQDSHILSKGDKPQWDFWSSVFYCGTIFTTIGLNILAAPASSGRATADLPTMADGGGSATKTEVGSAPASVVRKPKTADGATKNDVGGAGVAAASVVRKPKATDGSATKTDGSGAGAAAASVVRKPKTADGSAAKTDVDRSAMKTDGVRSSTKPDSDATPVRKQRLADGSAAKTDVSSSATKADVTSAAEAAASSGTSVVRKPSRRSPTTGHRRKKTDMKRSQSSPREHILPTSSDDEGRSFPRRKSLSPPGPEPKKVLRRRHRLRDKSQESKDDPINDGTAKDCKPPVDVTPKKDDVKAKKDDAPTKHVTPKPEKTIEPKSDLPKEELRIEPKNVDSKTAEKTSKTDDNEPQREDKVKEKVTKKVKESESESDGKNTRPNSWWGGWSPFKRKEPKTDTSEVEATGDEGEKVDDYLSTDDETAAEFIKILSQSHNKSKSPETETDRRTEPKIDEETPLLARREPSTKSWAQLCREARGEFAKFRKEFPREVQILKKLRNRCFCELFLIFILCGCGAFVFKTTEGSFENFYKCGVKRVKRDFIDDLWRTSHFMKEEDWKSKARNRLKDFEEQLATAFDAGMSTYSGQRSWSFTNAIIYCLTVITTIGYGHIAPVTTSGRALTIAYSIIGIPLFLILLADFGKLFTRCIKFLWAFVRRLYYTGSCRKVRRTGPVQEVMKGMQMVYDTIRRPSMFPQDGMGDVGMEAGTPGEAPSTPALSTFAVDDEFNLPISVAISVLLVYIFMGATVFWFWEEDWTFFESFYFVFISMSTIGFGDLVPKNQMYMMASIVYLAFGLALTSMCINVVQEKLSDSFRKASAKIGATIGLKVSEDDGTISPVSPTQVEIAGIHRPISHFDVDVQQKVP